MGHCITKDGLKIDEKMAISKMKIKAISKMQEPKYLKEIRRFIGMTNYL